MVFNGAVVQVRVCSTHPAGRSGHKSIKKVRLREEIALPGLSRASQTRTAHMCHLVMLMVHRGVLRAGPKILREVLGACSQEDGHRRGRAPARMGRHMALTAAGAAPPPHPSPGLGLGVIGTQTPKNPRKPDFPNIAARLVFKSIHSFMQVYKNVLGKTRITKELNNVTTL